MSYQLSDFNSSCSRIDLSDSSVVKHLKRKFYRMHPFHITLQVRLQSAVNGTAFDGLELLIESFFLDSTLRYKILLINTHVCIILRLTC
ncbi:hypothetical protein KSF78_0005032 [Schistosoma japonicum]|nr:hypothetical protein KSF78_0005032 [Schistosoma japonicum]